MPLLVVIDEIDRVLGDNVIYEFPVIEIFVENSLGARAHKQLT